MRYEEKVELKTRHLFLCGSLDAIHCRGSVGERNTVLVRACSGLFLRSSCLVTRSSVDGSGRPFARGSSVETRSRHRGKMTGRLRGDGGSTELWPR